MMRVSYQILVVAFVAVIGVANGYLAVEAPNMAVLVVPAPKIDAPNYQKLISQLQAQFGGSAVVSAVKMPSNYNYNYNPEKEIAQALSQIMISQNGKRVLLLGHSWGGHAIQNFIKKYNDGQFKDWQIAGGVLMASSVQRNLVKIQKDGKSQIDLGNSNIPIMVVGAELDGLNRVTRFAESYYHTNVNINQKQKGQFTTLLIRGMNHAQFANADAKQPDFIQKNDLKAESSQDDNLNSIVKAIASKFLKTDSDEILQIEEDTQTFLATFVDAMEQEGYYQLKPACYASDMINPDDPTCLQGSPFVSKVAHNMMADDKHFKNPNVKLVNYDQFHRATTVVPVHHPVIDGSCTLESSSCLIKTYTITENYYVSNNDFNKLDRFQCAAWDMKSKLKSRQALRIASGETDADFHQYDEVGNRCAEINQVALDWALKAADKQTRSRYEQHGQKLEMVDDRNTINGGLWIVDWMTYSESSDKTKMQASSFAYRMGEDFPIEAFAGDHYCKLLSPFKALEWIAVDSLYAKYQSSYEQSGTISELVANAIDSVLY